MLVTIYVLVLAAAVAYGQLQLWSCLSESSPLQSWLLETSAPVPNAHVTLQGSRNSTTGLWLLLGIQGNDYSPGTEAGLSYNATGPAAEYQQWNWLNGSLVSHFQTGLCLTYSIPVAGTSLEIQPCAATPGTANQTFSYEPTSGQIAAVGTNLCVDGGTTASCATAPLNATIYCDPDASTAERVSDLVPRILPEEFPQLLANTGFGVPVGSTRGLGSWIPLKCTRCKPASFAATGRARGRLW